MVQKDDAEVVECCSREYTSVEWIVQVSEVSVHQRLKGTEASFSHRWRLAVTKDLAPFFFLKF